jgi:ketosteroid isomerase-like protein
VSDDALHVTNLAHRFARLVDSADLAEVAELLTDDISWRMAQATWHGRDEVLAGLAEMRRLGHAGPHIGTRHVITNLEIDLHGDHAIARSYFQLVSRDKPAQIHVAGAYTDELRRNQEGRWRLADRQVTA